MLYVTLRQMEYVVAVARAGGFSEAARELSVSQPSLSVAVSFVERRIGQTLFLRRRGAAVALTPQGRAYVDKAAAILERASALEDADGAGAESADPIVLGCFTDLAPLRLAKALKSARMVLPGIDVTFEVGGFRKLAEEMQKGRMDLAITFDLGLDGSFERRELGIVAPFAIAASTDPIASLSGVSLRQLADRPMIFFDDGLSAQHMLRLFRDQGLNPRVVHRAASLEAMRSLAAAGEGIGLSYSAPASPFAYDGTPVATIRVSDEAAEEPVVLARTALAPPSPAVAAICDAIAAQIEP